MIKLSFTQKVRIIDHLSVPDNWSNIFNMSFFTDESRKWSRKTVDDLTISASPDGTKCKVMDEKNGRSLAVSRQGGRVKVTDEHNQSFILSEGTVKSRGDTVSDVTPIRSTEEFGFADDTAKPVVLESMGVVLRFNDDGSKAVFFEDIGHRVDMNAHGDGVSAENHPGRFFHKISLTEGTFKEWDIHPAYAMMFAKLVIAKDLNIEPGLHAQNEIDEQKAAFLLAQYLKERLDDMDMPETWKGNQPISMTDLGGKAKNAISAAEKPWDDTTEFGGYDAALPNRFFITKTDDGYDLTTSSDAKHSIWSQGELLRQARGSNILSIQTVNANTAAENVLHMLNKGNTVEVHLGREWQFVVLDSPAAQKVVTNMNDVAHNAFGIDSHDYAAINFDDTRSLLAIEGETLGRVMVEYAASRSVMKMITDGDTDTSKLNDLLDMGADYRYIDPDAASKGRTFTDLMKESENFELLAMMRDVMGIHPDMPDMDELDDMGDHDLHI